MTPFTITVETVERAKKILNVLTGEAQIAIGRGECETASSIIAEIDAIKAHID